MVDVLRYVFQDWQSNRANQFSRSVLVTYRIGHLIAQSGMPSAVRVPVRFIHRLINAFVLKIVNSGYITPLAEIGPGLKLPNGLSGVFINGQARVGANVVIFHQVTLGTHGIGRREAPTIGDDVVVGAGAKVIGGVHVGDRAIIGANSLVAKDVPADHVAIGVPARVIRMRPQERQDFAANVTG
jgi:serine acetyltransferase